MPYIHRKFTRQHGELLDHSSVNGINEGNSGIQMLPDNRLRAGFTHRF